MKQHHFYTVSKSSEISCALVYFPDCLFKSFLNWYSSSAMSFLGFLYIIFFWACKSLLATSLLLSPNYDFWRMSGFEPRVLLQQTGVLLTEPPTPSLYYVHCTSSHVCKCIRRNKTKMLFYEAAKFPCSKDVNNMTFLI